MNIFHPISISLSPNTERDDILLAFGLLFYPWKWRKGFAIEDLEKRFTDYLGLKYTLSFNSGRSAFLAILKSLNLEPGSEVLLQAFTCNAAANPIIWAEFNPVYVDCREDTFNIDVNDLEKKITSRSRVLVVQHTFGLPAEMDRILEIARKHNLILIEDCAHSLGAEYHNKRAGTFGDVAFFSFSRDKIISSVYGGMVATNDGPLAERIRGYRESIDYPSRFWIFQQLLHPILMNWLILPTYNFLFLGRTILIFSQWFRVLSKAVHRKEKKGKKPPYFPARMPNALAYLALNQFDKLGRFNDYREELADFYFNDLKEFPFGLPQVPADVKHAFLRFTIKHPRAYEIIRRAWRKNLLIGDWYISPVAPYDTKLDKLKYEPGSCPKAEKLAQITFNLPTHINISSKEARKVANFLKDFR